MVLASGQVKLDLRIFQNVEVKPDRAILDIIQNAWLSEAADSRDKGVWEPWLFSPRISGQRYNPTT